MPGERVGIQITGGTIDQHRINTVGAQGYPVDAEHHLQRIGEISRYADRMARLTAYADLTSDLAAQLTIAARNPMPIDQAAQLAPLLAPFTTLNANVTFTLGIPSVEYGNIEAAAIIASEVQSGFALGEYPMVALMGTDAMTRIAALREAIYYGTDVRVLHTGAMISHGEEGSDAQQNIAAALAVAQRREPATNSSIVFDHHVYPATDVLKLDPTPGEGPYYSSPNELGSSITQLPLRRNRGEQPQVLPLHLQQPDLARNLFMALENVTIIPHSLSRTDLREHLVQQASTHKYIVINGTGSGNMQSEVIDTLRDIVAANIVAGDPYRNIIIVTSENPKHDVNVGTDENRRLFAFNEAFGTAFVLSGDRMGPDLVASFAAMAQITGQTPEQLQQRITHYCQTHFRKG